MEHHQSAVRCRRLVTQGRQHAALSFQIQMSIEKWESGWASGHSYLWDVHFCEIEINLDLYQWLMERTTVICPEICDHNCMAKKIKLHSHLSIDQDSCQVQSKYFHYTSWQMFWTNVLKNMVWRSFSLQFPLFPLSWILRINFPFLTLTFSIQLWSQIGRSSPSFQAGINPEDES